RFAGMFGLLSEERIRGIGHNWNLGEDVSFLDTTVRNFNDPHQSIPSPQPAKSQELGNWDFTNAAKHNNAGVLTHWFYLLSEGGTYNGVTVQGVGIEQADDIAFTTMMWWLWGNSNYMDARNQSVYATIADWGGKCSYNHKQVLKAWAAVGLGTWYIRCLPAIINAPGVIDHTAIPSDFVFTGGLLSETGDNLDNILPDQISWIMPEDWSVEFSEDKMFFIVASVSNFESKRLMSLITQVVGETDTMSHIVHFTDCSSGDCGNGPQLKKLPNQGEEAQSVAVYPNPVSDGVTNILFSGKEIENAELTIFSIEGRIVKKLMLENRLTSIETNSMSPGVYIFKVSGKDFIKNIRVIIK